MNPALFIFIAVLAVMLPAAAQRIDGLRTHLDEGFLTVEADIVLDSLTLRPNEQVFITAVAKDSTRSLDFPSLLVSGRNMHYAYERGSLNGFDAIRRHDVLAEIRRSNGKPQVFFYSARVPAEEWMRAPGAEVGFVFDECGCGSLSAETIGTTAPLFHNPWQSMQAVLVAPPVTDRAHLPVAIHEGRARVQFEVNRTDLHVEPFRCKNGKTIDNRAQIRMIDDSVSYALADPNVELAGITLCGYASPESPYLHNSELAEGRSRALAEYLADRYALPRGSVRFSSVAENWAEFRDEVIGSNDLSDTQRADLLALIDTPASTPEEYDAKESILKTDPRFARLYKTKILPEWFPRLRATTFEIRTRLKPMDDEGLARVIRTSPEKMSADQMYRVARIYPKGSEEFNEVIRTMLRFYPDDPTAIADAATLALERGDTAGARALVKNAPDTPEIWNLRGILATEAEDFTLARDCFRKALPLETARRNLDLLTKERGF